MIKKIESSKHKIIRLLKEYPAYRNSDMLLLKGMWHDEIKNLNKLSAKELLQLLTSGKLTNPETVRRCRQKVQEQNPELRGNNHYTRKQMADDVRSKIKKI